MSARDDGNDVVALARSLGIAGFSAGHAPEAEKPAEDPMAAAGRAVGLKTGASLVPEATPANDNRAVLAKPATAAPTRSTPPAGSVPKVKVAAAQPSGSYFWISGSEGTLQRVQKACALPSDSYTATLKGGTKRRAWALPVGTNMDAAMIGALMRAGAQGFGTECKLDRRYKAFGARAAEPLPAAVITRLRNA